MIKLIATDLDGTLMAPDHLTVTDRTYNALKTAHDKGIKIAVATGRPMTLIDNVISQVPFVDYIIYSNGSCVFDRNVKKIIHADLDEVAQTMDGYDSLIDFMKNDGKGMEKITFYGIYDEKYENVKKKLEEYGLDVCSSLPGTAEATSKTANKGSALLGICENIGIGADEVMSFGDAGNDCPMLDFAKYSFAMENGSDECKAHAKFVTKSNAEDGVAVAVEKYAL